MPAGPLVYASGNPLRQRPYYYPESTRLAGRHHTFIKSSELVLSILVPHTSRLKVSLVVQANAFKMEYLSLYRP